MTRKLFVYGTLDPDQAPSEVRGVVKNLKWIGAASVRGRLFDLGDYPGLMLDSDGRKIEGRLFELAADEQTAESTLRELDRYEEYDAARPAKSLFRRVLCRPLKRNRGRTLAWVYVYNRPLTSATPIKSGNWSTLTR